MAKRRKFKCSKCDRAFTMAAHLGRHMTTLHGQVGKAAAARKKTGKGKGKRGRPPLAKTSGAPRGRRPGAANISGGSFGRLAQLVDEARVTLLQRIRDLESAI